MGKFIPVLLSLLILLAFSIPVKAQEAAPEMETGQAQMGQMGDMDEDAPPVASMTSMPNAPGRSCGPGCSCDKCKMAMMSKGGMMGMHGDIDMMTRPGMNMSCRTPEFYFRHKDELGISPYQADALGKLYFSLKKDMITKGAVVKVLELDLSEIVTKPDFKLSDAQDKLKDIEKARTELRSAVLKASSDARDLLGPEQLEKLKELNMSLMMGGPGMPMPMAMPDGAMKEKMMEKMRQKMTE
jgi:hypothetical protein